MSRHGPDGDTVEAGGGAAGYEAAGPALRELQLLELEILRELDRRCAAESLRWFVIGGTLLGAVRHGGFVPWDDDIDVGMPRPDYERFEALCRRGGDARFGWQSPSTEPGYPFLYGKLTLAGSRVIDPALDHLAIPHEAFIDVFPIDGAPAGRLARLVHGALLKVAATVIGGRLRRTGLRGLAGRALRVVPRGLALALVERLARRQPFDASPFAVNAGGAWGYRRECQARTRLVPTVTLPFEGLAVPAPGDWDAYLAQVYGDYRRLPPEEARRSPHGLRLGGRDLDHTTIPPASPPAPSAPLPAPSAPSPAPSSRGTGGRRRRAAVVRLGGLLVQAGFAAGRLRAPRAYVVLATRDPARPGGNLEAIRRELEGRMPSVPVRVVGYRLRSGLRGRARSAWEACRAGYHLAAARLFVADDWLFPIYAVPARAGTFRVQVWHAAGALKKFGFSVLDASLGPGEDLDRLLPTGASYDLCLVSSAAAIGPFMDAFRLPRERFSSALGLPRTDALFDVEHRARAIEAVRRRYGLRPGARVLLYAPTFRGDNVRDARDPEQLDLRVLRDALADRWVLLLRAHPLVRRPTAIGPEVAGFAVDVSDWADMNELLLVADLLVTDYSSAIFEFALLGRPMAFLAPDLQAYEDERGFYIDYRTEVPGPVFATTSELARYVAAGAFDLARVAGFARRWFDVADGRASERFVERVVAPALRGERPRIEVEPRPEDRIVTVPDSGGPAVGPAADAPAGRSPTA